MFQATYRVSVCAVALVSALAWFGFTARADERNDQTDRGARKVFIVAMENHNWTQPSTTTNPQAIFLNPAAPFVNGLVSGTSGISDQNDRVADYTWITPNQFNDMHTSLSTG